MNYKLILNILTTINGGLVTGAALFNPLIGQDMALKVISALGICQIIVSGINSNLSTQANTVSSVASMTGVKVVVDPTASTSLAQMATDPAQPKIGTKPEDRAAVIAVAKGA